MCLISVFAAAGIIPLPLFVDWFAGRLIDPASSARSLLADAWRYAVDRGETELPCFYNLRQRPECAALVSSMIPPLFMGSTAPTSHVAQACVRHLIVNDPESARQMATAALASNSTTSEIAGLWLAGSFVTEPTPTDLTTKFATLTEDGAWAAIDLWRGDDVTSDPLAPMTHEKTAALIAAVGARFPNAGQRLLTLCSGNRNGRFGVNGRSSAQVELIPVIAESAISGFSAWRNVPLTDVDRLRGLVSDGMAISVCS